MNKEKEHIDNILKTHASFDTRYLGGELSNDDFMAIQKSFFDRESQWYASKKSRPDFTASRLQTIVQSAKKYLSKHQCETHNILDVGTGTGVLIQYINESFMNVRVHALDVSANQLAIAKSRYPDIETYQSDVTLFINPIGYDVIYCNACFGNLLNQQAALRVMSAMLNDNGIVVLSHPLGSAFVQELHRSNSLIVPNTLPTNVQQVNDLISGTPLTVVELVDHKGLYLCVLKQTGYSFT
ncbi:MULTISPECIES: class I SAM-dependent methyltransferase [Vibrio harveyi group]|uniref:class I SAM-dependent methyltransferase n=1 Tax=Vibrio harveyi group TaxID=717610 RepID=UPI000542B3EB|nr:MULTISPECIES: class I SAM-dependent methyltransferase [Vibrio harveyi group]EHR5764586.1 class I SAM-dependent methyltransferase [Vibrio parahaemolyticus]EHY0932669.1 class I SAM-dependent methyltransferase [Vibrio parahaemolyticus]EIZ0312341.1 class I SAM-dependent methyltransferase [Vibrio parahaemolyticus]EJE8515966.1 class I SAM-dependent methyltransferase [Vibrio parahaemolyticus]EJE8774762.1 class I SAM-dependent methyltransferase [Vibrio parahaemolyticus]